MRSLESEIVSALQARRLVARDFLWFVVRDRDTGSPVTDGMWSDVGPITCEVVNPESGLAVERTFYGTGSLVSISAIPLVSNITIRNVTISLSQIDSRAETLFRTYDCKQARVEIFRGLFDPDTRALVSPAPARFVGFVDTIEVRTPRENEPGEAVLTCSSHTQEMTRSNPDTRSDASQRLRSATDNFFQDAAVVGEWEHFWGKARGPVTGGLSQQEQAMQLALRGLGMR